MLESRGSLGDKYGGPRRMPLIGAAAVVTVVFIAVVVVVSGRSGTSSSDVVIGPAGGLGESAGLAASVPPTAVATIDLTRPTTVPTIDPAAPTPGAAGDKLVISKIGVEAPLSNKTVGVDGVMPDPNGPDDVAVYDFNQYWPGHGGVPGYGGNVVLGGHVDWGSNHGVGCKNNTKPAPCKAVFWDLGKLGVADQIQIVAAGKTYNYKVTSNSPIDAVAGEWGAIVASTAQETVTLITCSGDFNSVTHEYDNRQVVTAIRTS